MKLTKLNYECYKEDLVSDIETDNEIIDVLNGYRYKFHFPNGYGVSVIKHMGSYGYEDDLFELAVIKINYDGKWSLCFDTEITDDVIGYLNNNEVLELMERVKNL